METHTKGDEILEMIYVVIREMNEINPKKKVATEENAILFGKEGNLDSIGLVNLIVGLEEQISDRYGKTVSLADERALSLTESPFRTAGSLAVYILQLLNE